MREIADMMRLVAPYAVGVPEPVAVQYLRDAAIEFCQETRIWRHSADFNVIGGQNETLCTPDQAQIFEIENAWFNKCLLEPRPFGSIENWDRDDGQPRYITQSSPGSVRLVPGALEAGVLSLHLFLKPANDAEDFPDFLTEYERIIADGALARILMLPNQPFTNPAMAGAFGQSFVQGKDRNFNQNIKGKQRAPMRSRGRYL